MLFVAGCPHYGQEVSNTKEPWQIQSPIAYGLTPSQQYHIKHPGLCKLAFRYMVCYYNYGEKGEMISTHSGLPIAYDFVRVVHGGRGDYVEFSESQIILDNIHIPPDAIWRLSKPYVYYDEYRSNDTENVMLYKQRKGVRYADYLIGMWYISPKDLDGL